MWLTHGLRRKVKLGNGDRHCNLSCRRILNSRLTAAQKGQLFSLLSRPMTQEHRQRRKPNMIRKNLDP